MLVARGTGRGGRRVGRGNRSSVTGELLDILRGGRLAGLMNGMRKEERCERGCIG